MPAFRTTGDLVLRVAQLLNQVRPGADVSDRSRQTITTIYENVLAELIDMKAAYWPADEIPTAAFERLAMLIAVDSASSFGALPIILQAVGRQSQDEAREYCIAKLRLHVTREPQYEDIHVLSDWM